MPTPSNHRRTYAQFFTPASVVACCFALLDGALPPAPRIVDPACGDGAFLLGAAAHGLARPAQVAGCEIDAELVGRLRSLGLAGVVCADGLDPASLPDASFDLVIGNPPYGVATSARGRRGMPIEAAFLLRALDLVCAGGYVALVLPSGVLANERQRLVRAELLRCCTLLAVIALPRAAFRHAGTTAACSILLLRHAPAPPGHQVFFASAAGLDDLPALAAAYHRASAPGTPVAYRMPQSSALERRMDAHFWRPDYRLLLERMAAQLPLRPLGELIDRRLGVIAGDHVRRSRGEARGPGLPYEYYQTREFMAVGYNYAAIERCDERAYRRLAYTAVRRHDILVSCAGIGGAGSGRVCLITHEPGPSCTGDVLILRSERPDPLFLFVFLVSRCGRAQLLQLQNGVGTVNLSADELLQICVPMLPPDEQHVIAAGYSPIAVAHDRCMAALRRGDDQAALAARAEAERLLGALAVSLEARLLGP